MRNQNRSLKQFTYICSLILLTISCCVGIQAQNIFGRISGTVTDPAGAFVPNIKITITNEATKAALTTVTDAEGFYVADDLALGSYSVTAEANGFRRTFQEV